MAWDDKLVNDIQNKIRDSNISVPEGDTLGGLQPPQPDGGDQIRYQITQNDAIAPPDSRKTGESDFINTGVNGAIDVVDGITNFPNWMRDKSDQINKALIDAAERLRKEGGKKAEENLTKGRINRIFSDVSDWLQTGNNAVWAGVGLIAFIFFVRRF